MKLYGKDALKARLDKAASRNRLPHAIMFSGHEGSGRKIMARYAAQLFMCGNSACGVCAECRNIERDNHPDVIFVKRGCGGKYIFEPFREIIGEAYVRPNNGEVKLYVFEDAETMRPEHQNTLLKLIEEPPEHLRFVFTCENTSLIPETIMSRVTELEVPDTDVSDCVKFLTDNGVDRKKAAELSEMFAGNIKKSFAAAQNGAEDPPEIKLILTAQKAAAAVGKRDAYSVAAALSEFTAREDLSAIMGYLSRILRDALSQKYGEPAEFFAKNESQRIASEFSEDEILNMLSAALELEENETLNLNVALSASYFTSRIL